MFSKLATKVALHRAGLGNVSIPSFPGETKNKSGTDKDGGDGGFTNPFANVQWGVPKALSTWQSAPPVKEVEQPPAVGARAPVNAPKLRSLLLDGRPVVILFLRFIGCPFSEKIFLSMRTLANRNTQIHFIAVSHCTKEATDKWIKDLGGAWVVDVVVDQERELYAQWGLGVSNWGHLLHPRNGYNQYLLGKKEGVWGSQIGEGGSRWQVGGVYAVDGRGIVQWGGPMKSVDEKVELEEGIQALGFGAAPARGLR
ncbi:hypothetical protein B0J11DRAFT_258094 [Dendryphion nanum]|uniref:Thioredoxin domain-containing protein n=1 Tax=Dendryphion nanum TaxID=256645 RepID=A0A9P9E640_9PLEO|nr:hypothetical protein B0J11DRAFT_258094 [Dendryphion nanum]